MANTQDLKTISQQIEEARSDVSAAMRSYSARDMNVAEVNAASKRLNNLHAKARSISGGHVHDDRG